MTVAYYALNYGQNQDSAVVASSTNSKDLEIAVDLSKVPNREAALVLVENLENFILTQPWPAI
jgi:hypothetical protein